MKHCVFSCNHLLRGKKWEQMWNAHKMKKTPWENSVDIHDKSYLRMYGSSIALSMLG